MTDHEGHIVYTNLPHVDFPARRSTDYTTPADRMAPLAALLLRDPTTMIPALVAALDALRGRDDTRKIIDLAKEAAK